MMKFLRFNLKHRLGESKEREVQEGRECRGVISANMAEFANEKLLK